MNGVKARRPGLRIFSLGLMFAGALIALPAAAQREELPERVTFLSADGTTRLVGYVFAPARRTNGRVPGVVMMHGRAGAYSSAAKDIYDASTLSQRHQAWGELWAEQGYVAILVDGFGPRGYPHGFPRFSYESRPAELDEVAIRPLDAYGALAYLRSRADVAPERIGLQGWSNGGSATLAAMSTDVPAMRGAPPARGFRAALVFYPACGLKGQFEAGYRAYAPVRTFMGTADEEVSPRRCAALIDKSRADGSDVDIRLYEGATHSFDDPGRRRQKVEANARATDDAVARARAFFRQQLGR